MSIKTRPCAVDRLEARKRRDEGFDPAGRASRPEGEKRDRARPGWLQSGRAQNWRSSICSCPGRCCRCRYPRFGCIHSALADRCPFWNGVDIPEVFQFLKNQYTSRVGFPMEKDPSSHSRYIMEAREKLQWRKIRQQFPVFGLNSKVENGRVDGDRDQ